ncbi:MAG: hypothetical protein ACREV6_20450 [Clostridium sp.]|uniref:hypothetical protein n=1 Tax=Clostridium sp. TaxID=1506 RepID=UPI003D6CBA42
MTEKIIAIIWGGYLLDTLIDLTKSRENPAFSIAISYCLEYDIHMIDYGFRTS